MRMLAISPENRAQLAELAAFAERPENRYRLGEVEGFVPGDHPQYVRQIDSYRIVYTLTEHEGLVWRHLSISFSPARPGYIPHPSAVFTLATWCGFLGGEIVEGVTLAPGKDWQVAPSGPRSLVTLIQPFEQQAAQQAPPSSAMQHERTGQMSAEFDCPLGDETGTIVQEVPLPSWYHAWCTGPWLPEDRADVAAWLRSRPASVKALVVEFPPSCVVRLDPGAPFAIGIVSSYFDDGHLTVRPDPDTPREGWVRVCAPHAHVIGYYKGLDGRAIQALLGSATA